LNVTLNSIFAVAISAYHKGQTHMPFISMLNKDYDGASGYKSTRSVHVFKFYF